MNELCYLGITFYSGNNGFRVYENEWSYTKPHPPRHKIDLEKERVDIEIKYDGLNQNTAIYTCTL